MFDIGYPDHSAAIFSLFSGYPAVISEKILRPFRSNIHFCLYPCSDIGGFSRPPCSDIGTILRPPGGIFSARQTPPTTFSNATALNICMAE